MSTWHMNANFGTFIFLSVLNTTLRWEDRLRKNRTVKETGNKWEAKAGTHAHTHARMCTFYININQQPPNNSSTTILARWGDFYLVDKPLWRLH